MTKGDTPPACAACEFQCIKCSPECPLAPYFPVSEAYEFENVRKLFGISYVKETILSVEDEGDRDNVVKALKYEANMRRLNPVHGSSGVVCFLAEQLRLKVMQIRALKDQIRALDLILKLSSRQMDVPAVFGSNETSSSNVTYSFNSDETVEDLTSLEPYDEINNDSVFDTRG